MCWFHLHRSSKSAGPQYRHLFPPLARMALPACQDRHLHPEESSVEHSLLVKAGNTQFLQDSAPEFANILNWETTDERPATTETPITDGMQIQRRLNGASEVVIERVTQNVSRQPMAVSFEQASSFIKEARELVATGPRSETIETAIKHDITGLHRSCRLLSAKGPHSLQRCSPK